MKCGTARRMTISPSRVSISRRSPLLSPVGDLARDSNGQVFSPLANGDSRGGRPAPLRRRALRQLRGYADEVTPTATAARRLLLRAIAAYVKVAEARDRF